MIKIVTDTSALKQAIPTTTFTKEEQDLATAALLTAVTEQQGLGMSANQIGLNKRICVINVREEPLVLVNPTIVEESEEKIMYFEGCLSLPNQTIELARPLSLTIKYQDYNNNNITLEADGWLARAIQHEIDHLEGKLLIHHLSNLKKQFAIKKLAKIKNAQEL